MEQRSVGSLDVSIVGLGCNNRDERGVPRADPRGAKRRRRDGNEVRLRARRRKAGWRHARVRPADGRREPAASAHDRIDLYQMHQPDDSTPIGDTLEVLGELVHEARSESSVRANIDASTLRLSDEELAALEEP